jgi:PAS domain S-box-containing protein
MPDNQKLAQGSETNSAAATENRPSVSARLAQFEKRQNELWRLTFLLLFVASIGYALLSWDTLRSLAHRFEALPVGLIILVSLFAYYVWKRTQEISELRGLVHGMEQRNAEPPSGRQLEQLFEVISRSQQGFRDLIDSFEDILIALSLEGEIRAVNRSFSDLVGAPFQQIIGKPLSDFVEESSGDGRDLVKRALPRFLERRQWSGVVQVRVKGQNAVYYFDCVAHAMLRGDEVQGVTLLARDITVLRKNEARFTELFETLQEGIYIATPAGAILDANPALVRMLGYSSKEELLLKPIPEIFVDRAERKIIKDEVERQPMLQGREITLLRKDGASIVCLNTAAAVRDTSGNVLRYQGALMDITERREMERRLHQQQEFARRLVASFPDLIFVLDTNARYTFVSPSVKEVLGLAPAEVQALELGDRTHPEDRPALRALYDEIRTGRQTFASLEVRVRGSLGDWRRIRGHFSPLFDEAGQIDGVVISGRDVTELKRLEEQLIQAEKLAAMGQMLAGVAHELNNPLTAILGVTELLRERPGSDEATKRQLDLTHRQARRAARIVQNLLEFSRPASPQKRPLDINTILERTLQLHEHSLRRNNIAVDFHPQPNLPEVVGDANQLVQVFLNLITNAEQAIREIRDTGRIQIAFVTSPGRLSVTIQDDGVGIRPEALPNLFDPFFTTKRPGGGTGLGLSISMSIVREHGGALEATMLPAGGAAFTVQLPIAGEPPVIDMLSDAAPLDSSVLRSLMGSLKGKRVLVLDDEESIRMLLDEGLSPHGLRVDCAATADEAFHLAQDHQYAAILCDVNLASAGGAGSGRDAAARILAASGSRQPAVIFMTGDLVETPTEPPAPGAPRHLQKPFRISEVITVLQECLSASPLDPI